MGEGGGGWEPVRRVRKECMPVVGQWTALAACVVVECARTTQSQTRTRHVDRLALPLLLSCPLHDHLMTEEAMARYTQVCCPLSQPLRPLGWPATADTLIIMIMPVPRNASLTLSTCSMHYHNYARIARSRTLFSFLFSFSFRPEEHVNQ